MFSKGTADVSAVDDMADKLQVGAAKPEAEISKSADRAQTIEKEGKYHYPAKDRCRQCHFLPADVVHDHSLLCGLECAMLA